MAASGVNADLRKFGTIFPEIVHSFCTAVGEPQINACQEEFSREYTRELRITRERLGVSELDKNLGE